MRTILSLQKGGHNFGSKPFGAIPERDAINYEVHCPWYQISSGAGTEDKEEFLPWALEDTQEFVSNARSSVFVTVQS